MEIHKPKAAHNVKDFLVEIGTIVCGILIALSLEQAIEWTHRRHQVADAHEALRAELAVDASFLLAMNAEQPCADARLKLFENWAAGKTAIDSSRLTRMENRPLFYNLESSAWDVTKSSSVAALMPMAERVAYSNLYSDIANQMGHIFDERHAWDQLARYAGRTSLDESDRKALKADIASARMQDEHRKLNTPYILDEISRLHIQPESPPGRDPRLLCGPIV